MDIRPVTLEGRHVRLEPLSRDHFPALLEAGADPTIFRWYIHPMDTPEKLTAWAEDALSAQQKGTELPFATIWRETGKVIGSTRFMAIDRTHRRVEIGNTWVTPAYQRRPANTEAKLLMVGHAFAAWQCIRVEFKTDSLNEKSRNALLRIGAKEEGTLRQHMTTATERLRDSVYFSILDKEWPEAKAKLEAMLASRAA